jgi:hypothetical protein
MSVPDFTERIKSQGGETLRKLSLALIIVLVALLGFGLGRLSQGGERAPINIEYDPKLSAFLSDPKAPTTPSTQAAAAVQAIAGREVVGSSKGAKYHYAHCPGAKQISEANKVVFTSPEAAEASGYTLAGNCRPK